MPLTQDQVILEIGKLAFFAELQQENPFKVKALLGAVEVLSSMSATEWQDRWNTLNFTGIPGIGKGLMGHIAELKSKGFLHELQQIYEKVPECLFELKRVPGLGPKKIKVLFEELGISSVGELEYACSENRIALLKGFGEKTQKKLLESILHLKTQLDKFSGPAAWEDFEFLNMTLKKSHPDIEIVAVGALRRMCELVDAIDCLIISKKPVKNLPPLSSSGVPIHYHESTEPEQAYKLFRFTGSKADLDLISREMRQDFQLKESGIYKSGKLFSVTSEEEIYEKLGLHYVIPELREGLDEVVSTSKKFPYSNDLINQEDLTGAYHNHTTASDGADTLEDMISRASELGWQWIGISDHSQSAFYAQGLKTQRLLDQKKEIEKLQKKFPKIKIFHGVESDILSDGSLDYPDDVLKSLDFVIASVHSSLQQDEFTMTKRLCKALSHPCTTILGHPTGRLLLGRKGYSFSWEKILETASKNGKAIELNCNPHRLDIDWSILRKFKNSDVKIALSPDAHSTLGLEDLKWGVGIARKGGLSKKRLLNPLR